MALLATKEVVVEEKTGVLIERMYQRKGFGVEEGVLQGYLGVMKERYSEGLVGLVRRMTMVDRRKRCTLQEAQGIVRGMKDNQQQQQQQQLTTKLEESATVITEFKP